MASYFLKQECPLVRLYTSKIIIEKHSYQQGKYILIQEIVDIFKLTYNSAEKHFPPSHHALDYSAYDSVLP